MIIRGWNGHWLLTFLENRPVSSFPGREYMCLCSSLRLEAKEVRYKEVFFTGFNQGRLFEKEYYWITCEYVWSRKDKLYIWHWAILVRKDQYTKSKVHKIVCRLFFFLGNNGLFDWSWAVPLACGTISLIISRLLHSILYNFIKELRLKCDSISRGD